MGTSLEKTVARIAGDGGAALGRSRALLLDSRSIALGAVLSLATLAGCGHRLESDAQAGPSAPAPKVTVAEPLAVPIAEATEYTGRAEAVETVDVRPRSTGHLQRAAFHEGDLVKKGDLLFVIDPRPYDVALVRAKAELARARADEELAQRESARAEQLFESRAISERDVDTQRTSLVSLAARTRVAASAVSAAELDVEYAYVRAPISGRIGRIVVTPGNLVAPSLPAPLATIVTVDRLHVYVDVEEGRALGIGHDPKKAKLARVTFGEDRIHAREAAVDFIDNRVDPQTGTLKVRVVVNNDDGALSPGLFAHVRLPQGGAHDGLLVSDRAVATDQDRRFVWIVDRDGKVQRRPVKLGPLQDGLRVVREGLTRSDRVVVRGLTRVRPGARVDAEPIAMKDAEANANANTDAKANGGAP